VGYSGRRFSCALGETTRGAVCDMRRGLAGSDFGGSFKDHVDQQQKRRQRKAGCYDDSRAYHLVAHAASAILSTRLMTQKRATIIVSDDLDMDLFRMLCNGNYILNSLSPMRSLAYPRPSLAPLRRDQYACASQFPSRIRAASLADSPRTAPSLPTSRRRLGWHPSAYWRW